MNEPALRLVASASTEPVTLVDSCVLLDIATSDPRWMKWSNTAVTHAFDIGRVIVNPIIYAEVSIGYEKVEELDRVLPHTEYEREPLPYEAGFLAGKAFLAYRRRGGRKTSPLPDFYIGAHAAVRSYRLLTRDTARYRTYFPSLELITPT